MSPLASLLPIEEYYDYRGVPGADEDAPPLWLPHNQGDVFRDIELPGTEQTDERLVMLFQHPCTMRAGPALKPRVVVLNVTRVSNRLHAEPEYWVRKYSQIPLPGVLEPNDAVSTYGGDLLELTTVDSTSLARERRVASLSVDGRLQFQQRVIHYLTRFCPSLEELAEATNAVESEISLQGSWVERAVLAMVDPQEVGDVISRAEAAFEEFMSAEDRRARLTDVTELHRVNAEVHRSIDERYPTP